MSSRLVREDDPRQVEAMVWRTVGASDGTDDTFAAGLSGPERESGIDQRIRAAHAAGMREGEVSGQRRAAAELQPVIERLCRSIDEIGGLRARLRAEAERDLVQLALAIARRVLGRELAVDPDAIHGLVLGALDKVKSLEISRVRVDPAHSAAVSACLRKVGTAAVEVTSDPACAPGTVILETDRGSLDASVESQLQEIERGLADRLRRQA
ncbi:MAG TPA: FliH/SctL family protein [Bryobacteraceae bacterium]|nr:FliH/SctL family protein [Bryobacteraceae bacterium]